MWQSKLSGLKNCRPLLSLKVSRGRFGSGLTGWSWLEISHPCVAEISAWASVLLWKVVHSITESRVVLAGPWGQGEWVDYSGTARGHFWGRGTYLDLDMAMWLYVSVCQNSCNGIQGHSDMSVSKVKLKKKWKVTHSCDAADLGFSLRGLLPAILKVPMLWLLASHGASRGGHSF